MDRRATKRRSTNNAAFASFRLTGSIRPTVRRIVMRHDLQQVTLGRANRLARFAQADCKFE